MERLDDLANRLDALAEEVADAALDLLRDALEGDIDARAAERRATRARRAIEKGAQLLRGARSE